MAGGSVIGSLRVDLGLSSAQFSSGLKSAQSELSSFGRQMKAIGGGIAAGLAASFSVQTVEAFAVAVGSATKEVAELYRQAKITGTSFKDLQTLGYAFQQNGVAVSEFSAALREMQDKASEFATTGGGRAADALKMLGIDAAAASKALDNPAQMLRDIIGRLGDVSSHGAQIRAMGDIFGNSGGDKFLRILDLGTGGLSRLEEQAIKSGTVITDAMGARADELDRKFAALQTRWDTWWKSVAVGIADAVDKAGGPAIRPTARPGTVEYARQSKLMSQDNSNASWANEGLSTRADALAKLATRPTTFDFRSVLDKNTQLESTGLGSIASAMKKAQIGAAWTGGWGSTGMQSLADIKSGLSSVLSDAGDPFAGLSKTLTDLAKLRDKDAISTQAYGNAVMRTYAGVAGSAFDMASGVTGALSQMFKDNKGFAVANAVLQTLSGVANALGSGPPPWSIINAGIVAATGAANVANILATNENSTSMPGNAASGGAASAVSAAAPRQAVNISLRGGDFFSRSQVEKLLEDMADAMGDGAGSRLISVVKG